MDFDSEIKWRIYICAIVYICVYIYTLFPDWNHLTVRYAAVREAGASRYHGGLFKEPPETPLTSRYFCTEGFKDAPLWLEKFVPVRHECRTSKNVTRFIAFLPSLSFPELDLSITLFRLIWHQTELRLMINKPEDCNYNPAAV